jgi:hypothetical protein
VVDYITRVQEASLPATGGIASTSTPNQGKEEEPPGNVHRRRGIATFNPKGVAPQRPQESIAAYVTWVQIAVATSNGEAIAYTGNFFKDSNTPRWNNRTKNYIAAQAVFDARAVSRTWTDGETGTIAARNDKYGQEQQQATRYECRRIMTTAVTCKIVKKGLNDPLMCKVATQISEECTSTDSFKAKLTQIEEFNHRARPENRNTPIRQQGVRSHRQRSRKMPWKTKGGDKRNATRGDK